jgi:hypothetical protein
MSDADALATIPCPNCRQQMQAQDLEQNYHGTVRVDLCFACAGMWFDHMGSVQLAPGAVIELFKQIHSQLNAARQPLAGRLNCPRCGDALALGLDLCKSGRFSYFRCPRGDGRYTPFLQFLREKQFIRTLTAAELQRVRSQVRQIRCSECGAPIDLEQSSACQYCHAPVSFLDPDAVENAVNMWSDAEHRRHLRPTPEALGEALLRSQLAHPEPPATSAGYLGGDFLANAGARDANDGGLGPDLVAVGIQAIGRLF